MWVSTRFCFIPLLTGFQKGVVTENFSSPTCSEVHIALFVQKGEFLDCEDILAEWAHLGTYPPYALRYALVHVCSWLFSIICNCWFVKQVTHSLLTMGVPKKVSEFKLKPPEYLTLAQNWLQSIIHIQSVDPACVKLEVARFRNGQRRQIRCVSSSELLFLFVNRGLRSSFENFIPHYRPIQQAGDTPKLETLVKFGTLNGTRRNRKYSE